MRQVQKHTQFDPVDLSVNRKKIEKIYIIFYFNVTQAPPWPPCDYASEAERKEFLERNRDDSFDNSHHTCVCTQRNPGVLFLLNLAWRFNAEELKRIIPQRDIF